MSLIPNIPAIRKDDDEDSVRYLTSSEAKNLAQCLKTKNLPGLNDNERIHLVAMVNTIVEVSK
jgi:hypothetical protein